METSIGQVIKRLRQERKITLQQLSAQVGLSPSFLSQLERGNTTIAIDSLVKVAETLGTDIYAILNASQTSAPTQDQYILRSYQRHDAVLQSEHEIQTNLSAVSLGKAMMAREITLLPHQQDEPLSIAGHTGEEFLYILEGALTFFLEGQAYTLYPGDTVHFNSDISHGWQNDTNRNVCFLVINYPAVEGSTGL